jgi:cytochrome P450 family 142 subfamily A polypeptide 1
VETIAVPLPLLLIAEMIGIRREDRARFHRWSDDMIAADGHYDEPDVVARAGAAFAEYSAYVTEICEDRRRTPREDLVSVLVGADPELIAGSPDRLELANHELVLLLTVLLVAGNETTRNALSGGMQLLIENPGEREKLLRDPRLLPGAVEEMVRVVSPVLSFGRTVTADTELRGRKLEAGQKVLLLYPSANRDADVFDEPDAFHVDRNPHHLGFGLGSHFCLGANLARMELRVAFEELLRRMPDAEYAGGGPVFKPSALVRSCVGMEIRFTPGR